MTTNANTAKAVRFEGTGQSCDEVLALIGGPDPIKCVWKSCTYDGGVLMTAQGGVVFSKGDWIVLDGAGGLHVATTPFDHSARNSGLVRTLMCAWLGEAISEGRMVEATGLDRVALRTIKDDLIRKGVEALAGVGRGSK